MQVVKGRVPLVKRQALKCNVNDVFCSSGGANINANTTTRTMLKAASKNPQANKRGKRARQEGTLPASTMRIPAKNR